MTIKTDENKAEKIDNKATVKRTVNAEYLNVRTAPGTGAALAEGSPIKKGTELEVFPKTGKRVNDRTWIKVRFNGSDDCWVAKEYLVKV